MTIPEFIEEAVAKNPQKRFLFWQDEVWTYQEFLDEIQKTAGALRQKGVKKGDRVALLLPNSPEYIFAFLGLTFLGAAAVHFNPKWKKREIDYATKLTKPKFTLDRPLPTNKLINQSTNKPNIRETDVCSLIFTSGTTGFPKAVMQTHRTYVLTGQAFPGWVGLTERDRLLTFLPLYHINAQAYSLMGALGAGASLVLLPKLSVSTLEETCLRYRVTEFNTVGPILSYLKKIPKVRLIYHGGPLFEEKRQALQKRFGVKIVLGYGLSESTFGLLEGRPRQHPKGVINRVKLAPDGEILLKNPAVMKGYYGDTKATKETLKGGWLYTGDLGRRRGKKIEIIGRKKEMIRVKGENVSPSEVELVLLENPAVKEAAVVGQTKGEGDEEIVAFVVIKGKVRGVKGKLWEWSKENLADFKVPKRFVLKKTLPKTSTGRVAKFKLTR